MRVARSLDPALLSACSPPAPQKGSASRRPPNSDCWAVISYVCSALSEADRDRTGTLVVNFRRLLV